MRTILQTAVCAAFLFACSVAGNCQEAHLGQEQLGAVSFPVSCSVAAQKEFDRGVALLHSFEYFRAEPAFQQVTTEDPKCAMAYWGEAMTHFHELWDPPLPSNEFGAGQQEIRQAQQTGTGSDRERQFIEALALIYRADAPYRERVVDYEAAMHRIAAAYPKDPEAQIFYALALLAAASPFDKTHARQKRAAEILEPLFRRFPQHPGIAHYLIHAYDNQELAPRGLAAARAYARIAPAAPHALHMPSHIFTRLGMWDDSIRSNLVARAAAEKHGAMGEELHAMDYLVYAYLQEGREKDAREVIDQLRVVERANKLGERDFKSLYAAVTMPIRYAVERRSWAEAAKIALPEDAPPPVEAVAVWARALGLARSGHPAEARGEIERLKSLPKLQSAGDANAEYWAGQIGIQAMESSAWVAEAEHRPSDALSLMREAADQEDAAEKLPVTPGPVIPAREQLGDLLLEQNQPALAIQAYRRALQDSPKRRGALNGLARAQQLMETHRIGAGNTLNPRQHLQQDEVGS